MKKYLLALVAILALAVSGCQSMAGMSTAPEGEARWDYEVPPASSEDAYAPYAPVGGTQTNTVERMVIRTAELDLVVPNTEEALRAIEALLSELDGYVVSLSTYQYEQGVQGSVTVRVPAESFNTALERIKVLATTVRRESIQGQDVTDEYVDLESRLRHLRAVEEQLLGFLEEAEDTEATLSVYERLQQVQGEIEQVSGRMQYLENQVALATIIVQLTPDALAQPLEVGGWNLPGTVRSAVEALLNTLEVIVKAAIYLVIVVLPTLVILLAPVVAVVLLVRWLIRRRKRAQVKGRS